MQSVDQLNEAFGIPDLLTFDEPHPGMPRARVTSTACSAELFLQGAHLTQWQPAGQQPVLFLSERSAYAPGKAIRGGIPVIFPWFGAPQDSPVHPPAGSPSHGVARTSPWTLRFAALAGDDLHLSLILDRDPDHQDRLQQLGMGGLQLGLDVMLGAELTLRLTAAYAHRDGNPESPALTIEQALHTYVAIGDIHQISIEGLQGTEYLDKTQGFQARTQAEAALVFNGEVDRPYLNTTASVSLLDPVLNRRLTVSKENSQTTVIWNPAPELASKLPDLAPGDWQHFACIETANAAANALRLTPGEAHAMTMHLAVTPLNG